MSLMWPDFTVGEFLSVFQMCEWSLQSKEYLINNMGVMGLSLDIIKTKNMLYHSFCAHMVAQYSLSIGMCLVLASESYLEQ